MKCFVIILIILAVILLVIFLYKESTGFRVVRYEITSDKIKKDLKIAFLSDLHDTDTDTFADKMKDKGKASESGYVHNRKLLDTIKDESVDYVMLSGDMITSYMQPKYNSSNTFEFLRDLSKEHKVIYGIGNHEQRYLEDADTFPGKFEQLKKFVKEQGIEFLENDNILLEDYNVRVFGIIIPLEYYRRVVTKHFSADFMEKSIGKADEGCFNILLAHTPEHFDDYVLWNADLVLSGHVHGGIIGIPGIGGVISPQLKLFPKYDFGEYKKDNSTMILSRGIGWHTIPVRVFNKAELVIIDIKKCSGQ